MHYVRRHCACLQYHTTQMASKQAVTIFAASPAYSWLDLTTYGNILAVFLHTLCASTYIYIYSQQCCVPNQTETTSKQCRQTDYEVTAYTQGRDEPLYLRVAPQAWQWLMARCEALHGSYCSTSCRMGGRSATCTAAANFSSCTWHQVSQNRCKSSTVWGRCVQ